MFWAKQMRNFLFGPQEKARMCSIEPLRLILAFSTIGAKCG
jgi:hypothetical protein